MGLYEEWLDLRARITELADRKAEVQEKLLAEMGNAPMAITYGGKTLKLTPVTGEKTTWNKAGVLDALSVPLRRRLSVAELDVAKFEAALTSGELDEAKFADFKSVEPIKPYIRVSTKA
jgi:hypothetical protein